MRARTLLLIIGIVLMAGFAVLNVDEFTRTSTLNLGFTSMQLPLGLLMLMLLITTLLVFLAVTLYMQSTNLLENRRHAKEMTAQRELADKAEASRFTELRSYMEAQATLAMNRETETVTALDRRLALTEKLLLQRLEQSDNTTAAYWGQHDDALMRNKTLNTL